MHSVKRILATLVLLIVPFKTAPSEPHKRNAITLNGVQRLVTPTVVKAQDTKSENGAGGGSPADLSSSEAAYFSGGEVAAVFAKGGTLVDWSNGEWKYRVGVHRQDKPGTPEMHTQMTHVFYVLEGTATYVSGGKMIDPKITAPNTIHGTAIEGGEIYHLSKGDVIVVPRGVPHWYKEVQSPLVLFDVNVH